MAPLALSVQLVSLVLPAPLVQLKFLVALNAAQTAPPAMHAAQDST